MSRLFGACCAAAWLVGAPFSSAAADPARPAAIAVRFSDLDLASTEGARRMLRRIERAAAHVCGESVALQYPSTRRAYEDCRQAAIANTVDQLGAPMVSEHYARRFAQAGAQEPVN